MADDEYNKKLESLQQYIPFLNNMIVQLKDPRKKNREQQLTKMVSLHSMITDKKKKLKLETLIKCEEVIQKLFDKVHPKNQKGSEVQPPLQSTIFTMPPPIAQFNSVSLNPSSFNNQQFTPQFNFPKRQDTPQSPPRHIPTLLNRTVSPITPRSPTPPAEIPFFSSKPPVVIPTEKVQTTNNDRAIYFNPPSTSTTSTNKNRIDIYSSAADSLTKKSPQKLSVFDRLGEKTDMSKPPISLQDLEELQNETSPPNPENMSLGELTDLREKLQKQLNKTVTSLQQTTINTTVRNTTKMPIKKPVEKSPIRTPDNDSDKKNSSKTITTKQKPVTKVLKEAPSIFGDALSEIDQKLLHKNKDTKEKEKTERRHSSSEKEKDRSKHKDHKDEKDKKHRDKDKKPKSSSDKKADKSLTDDLLKIAKRDKEKNLTDNLLRLDKNLSDGLLKIDKNDKDRKRDSSKDKSEEKIREKLEKRIEKVIAEKYNNTDQEKEKTEKDKIESKNEVQTFKRLADKYNPKPRKPSIENDKEKEKPATVTTATVTSTTESSTTTTTTNTTTTTTTTPTISKIPNSVTLDNDFVKKLLNILPPVLAASTSTVTPNSSVEAVLPKLAATEAPSPIPIRPPISTPPIIRIIPGGATNTQKPLQMNVTNNPYLVNQMEQQNLMLNQQSMYTNQNQQSMFTNQNQQSMFTNQNQQTMFTNQNQQFNQFNQQQFGQQQFNQPTYNQQQQFQPRNQGYQAPRRNFTPFDPINEPLMNDQNYQFEPEYLQQAPQQLQPQPSKRPTTPFREQSQPPVLSPQVDYIAPKPKEERQDWRRDTGDKRDNRWRNDRNSDRRYERWGEYNPNNNRRFKDDRDRQSQPPRRFNNNRYNQPPQRSRSPSRSSSKDREDFASPLNSLYSRESRDPREPRNKATKSSGIQNFKIPKLKREDNIEKVEIDNKVTTISTDMDAVEPSVSSSTPEERPVALPTPSPTQTVPTVTTMPPTVTTVESEVEKNEISSTNNEAKDDKVDLVDSLRNVLKDKTAYNFILKALKRLHPEELNDDDEDDEDEDVKHPEKEEKKAPAKKKKRPTKVVQADDSHDDDEAEEEEEEEEMPKAKSKKDEGSSGNASERVKNRKRQRAFKQPLQPPQPPEPPEKKKKKCKTELDLLHEDISDMFIRDGVLTATGKRMCCILKTDHNALPQTPSKRVTRTSAEKSPKKDVKDVRVLINKIPEKSNSSDIVDDDKRYSLRSSRNTSYVENSDDESKVEEDVKEKEKPKEKIKAVKEKEKEEPKKMVTKTKKVIKKKKSLWASGVILRSKKRAHSTNSSTTEAPQQTAAPAPPTPPPPPKKKEKKELKVEQTKEKKAIAKTYDLALLEPDKNYYFDKPWIHKHPCKLCSYRGKSITNHYKLEHPECEILCSRLRPDIAELAIKRSIENNWDENEEDQESSRYERWDYQCIFCFLIMNTNSFAFYDHISLHTGEFRYCCELCNFAAGNMKRLRAHSNAVHNGEGVTLGLKRGNLEVGKMKHIYGYICSECNFVQVEKKTVENHVHIYHLGDNNKVHKINLSEKFGILPRPSNDKDENEEHKESDEEPFEIKKPTRNRKVVRKQKENVKSTADLSDDNETDAQAEVHSDREDTPPPAQEIDMTVFTCNTEINQENEQVEADRIRKMTELSDSVKVNRQSLNFIDQLSNRLMLGGESRDKIQVKKESGDVNTKEVPMDLEPEPVVQPTRPPLLIVNEPQFGLYKNKTPSLLTAALDRQKPVESHQTPPTQTPSIQLHCSIQPPQLKEITDPPPLMPIEELNNQNRDSRMLLNAGFLQIWRDNNNDAVLFKCCVPSCLFSTSEQPKFAQHWSEDHTNFNQNLKHVQCEICTFVVETVDNSFLTEYLNHVIKDHCDNIEKITEKTVIKPRRLSGDLLSNIKKEKKDDDEIILDNSVDCPFPFKIADVKSLAVDDEDEPPKASPVKIPSPVRPPNINNSIVLTEVRLTSIEKTVLSKSGEALKKFLQNRNEFYKCPSFFCKFSTNTRNIFDCHVKSHVPTENKNTLTPCVYCDIKTPLLHSGLHIDVRHSNCLYTCSLCLYRALKKQYVQIHIDLRHAGDQAASIISLPPRKVKYEMHDHTRNRIREYIVPYKCGQKNCNKQFLFPEDFVQHLRYHKTTPLHCGFTKQNFLCQEKYNTSDDMLQHWSTHNCLSYHCIYCRSAFDGTSKVVPHFATDHPNIAPVVAVRVKNGVITRNLGCTVEAFNAITILNEDYFLLSDNGKAQKKIIFVKRDPLLIAPVPQIPVPEALTAEPPKDVDVENVPEPEILIPDTAKKDGAVDPLSLEADSNSAQNNGEDSDSQEFEISTPIKSFGLVGTQLYGCAFCEERFDNGRAFRMHYISSKNCQLKENSVKPFVCVHCTKTFKNPHSLLEHIQGHGALRFTCSLCNKKFAHLVQSKSHMRLGHNVANSITIPLNLDKTNPELDDFILKPKPASEEPPPQPEPSEPANKNTFSPDQINDLPQRHIFINDVKCALCLYSTKVRTNLVRHLQSHSGDKSVPEMAPVNPVPCWDKSEKMFDKMTNLAISSFTGTSGGRMGGPSTSPVKVGADNAKSENIPQYIPTNRRYVCCADNCSYLCPEEANLRHHLFALHESETFACAHCKDSDSFNDPDSILKHLKLHDLHLYKCSNCSFVHYLKHKVERHLNDKHPEKLSRCIVVRDMEAENGEEHNGETTPTSSNKARPWHCGMCKYKCCTENDVLAHISNKHDVDKKYKCTLCTYKNNEKDHFVEHFKEHHPSNAMDVVEVYYKVENTVKTTPTIEVKEKFDTTPLWQRDRPRVRHIRGILFEENSSYKKKSLVIKPPLMPGSSTSTATASTPPSILTSPAKTAAPSGSVSNLDLAIDAVARGTADCLKITNVQHTDGDEDDFIKMLNDQVDEIRSEQDKSIRILEEDEELTAANTSTINTTADESVDESEKTDPNLNKRKRMPELLNTYGTTPLLIDTVKCPLSEERLKETFGGYSHVAGTMFRCPICLRYRTRKIPFFIHHVLSELNYMRCQCSLCDFKSITVDSIRTHLSREHRDKSGSLNEGVKYLPENYLLHYWLQVVLQKQCRSLIEVMQPIVSRPDSTILFSNVCQYCNRWFQSTNNLREHELFHYAKPIYTCGHCEYTSITKSIDEIFEHLYQEHKNEKIYVKIEEAPDVGAMISALKNPPPSQFFEKIIPKLEPPEVKQPESTISSVVEPPPPVLAKTSKAGREIFVCGHCDEKGNETDLVNHHAIYHAPARFLMYQVECLECNHKFKRERDIKIHFKRLHPNKSLNYKYLIDNKTNRQKPQLREYTCTICKFCSTNMGGMKNHVRKHVKPIMCKVCGEGCCNMAEYKSHHQKEHYHSPESYYEDAERIKEFERHVAIIIANKKSPIKNTARKSTGPTRAPLEFSYYGQQAEPVDMRKITTYLEVNKCYKLLTGLQLETVLNINPIVLVEDIQKKS